MAFVGHGISKMLLLICKRRLTKSRWSKLAAVSVVVVLTTILCLVLYLIYPWRGIKTLENVSCSVDKTLRVPKVVHRIWDQTVIPDRYKDYLENCHRLNPDYKLMIWNASAIENFLRINYPWSLDLYAQYPHKVLRYDAARYFIIHHFGGIYLDMDMGCIKGFDAIFSSTSEQPEVFLGQAFPAGVVSNFLIAKPKTQFFNQVIHNLENTKDEKFVVNLYETFAKTGPLFLYKNYFNYQCQDQIHILSKFKIRGEWLSHDGAGTWQSTSGVVIMFISNSWAALYSLFNYFFLVTIILAIVFFVRRRQNRQPRLKTKSECIAL